VCDGVGKISKGKTIDEISLSMDLIVLSDLDTSITTSIEKISKGSSHLKVFWLIFIPIPYGTYGTREPLFNEIQKLAKEKGIEVLKAHPSKDLEKIKGKQRKSGCSRLSFVRINIFGG